MNIFHQSELLRMQAQERQAELLRIAAQFSLARTAQPSSPNLVERVRSWWRQQTTPTPRSVPRVSSVV